LVIGKGQTPSLRYRPEVARGVKHQIAILFSIRWIQML
jgi:hypothetical protein